MILFPVISQSPPSEFSEEGVYIGDETLFYSGNYGRVCAPKSIFYNGATYITGTDGEENRNPILIRYLNGRIDTVRVGTIDNYDELFHQNATVMGIDGYIYVFCVNGHGEAVKIWKSNTPDIVDGFTLHYQLEIKAGYLNTKMLSDGRCLMVIRITGTFTHQYAQMICISAVNDLTSWQTITPMDAEYATYDIRFYPSYIQPYGDNEWQYFGISLRSDDTTVTGTQTYMGQAIYKTKDFETFYNLSETFSKNIVVDGIITALEVKNNFTVVGWDDVDVYFGTLWAIIINDVIYGSYFNPDDMYFKFYKIENGVKTEYPCEIPDLPTTPNFSYMINLYYNGDNIVIHCFGKIYSCGFDFSGLTLLKTLPSDINLALLPEPFTDVIGKEYMIAGTNVYQGYFPYVITNEIFNQ